MTIFLVFGLFAALYMLWLLFSLATYALPFYVGLAVTFWLHGVGYGMIGSILLGILAGALAHGAGQVLFQATESPLVRFSIASLFVAPAGFAGFEAVHGIGRLALGDGVVLTMISTIGGLVIASAAWRRITGTQHHSTAASSGPIEQPVQATTATD